MHKKFGLFSVICGFYYIVQFICCVSACNFYSDNSRKAKCTRPDGTSIDGDQASEVFDLAIKLCGIFHIIEWIRCTILLVIICIGANLFKLWYLSSLSTLYGIAVFIYLHIVYASSDAKACGTSQVTRYQWMMVEIIYFWTLFFFN